MRSLRSVRQTRASLAALAIVATGCGSSSSLSSVESVRASPASLTPLTDKVVVIADTQFQYLYGAGALGRDSTADRIAPTAVRPAQLDMFSGSLLHEACSVTSGPLLHLGDAANTSCSTELERFFSIMKGCRARSQWAFAPGNHDGFYLGTLDTHCNAEAWKAACGEQSVMSKDGMLSSYLGQLGQSGTSGLSALDKAHIVREVAWEIVEARQRSYIAQLVELSAPPAPVAGALPACVSPNGGRRRVLGVLMDTSQYEKPPRTLPRERNAGWTGSILSNQREQVERWVEAGRREGALLVLMGHHPIDDLEPDTRNFVQDLVERTPNVVLFVSAHTHSGSVRVHPYSRAFVELNVGSVTDTPNEYRDVQLACDQEGVYLLTNRNPGAQPPHCPAGWLPTREDFTDYQSLRGRDPEKQQLYLLRAQARTWLRMLDRIGLSDEATERRVREQLLIALSANTAQQSTLLRDAARTAECEEARDAPCGVSQGRALAFWPSYCGPAPSCGVQPNVEHRARLHTARSVFKRCTALRASQYEWCAGPCGRTRPFLESIRDGEALKLVSASALSPEQEPE